MDEVCIHVAQETLPLLVLKAARNWLWRRNPPQVMVFLGLRNSTERQWKKPLEYRNKNDCSSWWEFYQTEFTCIAALWCRRLKLKRDLIIKRFWISGWERTAPQIRSDDWRCCHCTFLHFARRQDPLRYLAWDKTQVEFPDVVNARGQGAEINLY